MNTINFYETLNCHQRASLQELKRSYQSLLLKYHPDKKSQTIDKVIQLNEAWNVLRDPEKRKAYDAQILQGKFNENHYHEEVYLTDLQYDQEMNNYFRKCRCGEIFVISKVDLDDLDTPDCELECDGCSLVILVKTT